MALANAKLIELVEAIELLRSAGWTVEPPASTSSAKRVGRPQLRREYSQQHDGNQHQSEILPVQLHRIGQGRRNHHPPEKQLRPDQKNPDQHPQDAARTGDQHALQEVNLPQFREA